MPNGMTENAHHRAAGSAVCAYALWNARHLAVAWLHSPFDRCGFPSFLLWLIPLVWHWHASAHEERPALSFSFFFVALVLSFVGVALDLNAIKSLAFAVSLAGFLPIRPATFLWLGCAFAWMPAAGWLFTALGPMPVNCLRIALGIAAASLTHAILSRETAR